MNDRLEHTVAAVPERNRKIKKLLEQTYLLRGDTALAPLCPGLKISVTAGKGTSYRWVNIRFSKRPPNPRGMLHNNVEEAIVDLIVGAGIYIATFPRDDAGRDFGTLPCVTITFGREE